MITILHLGLGRFHRAHQAVYYQNLIKQTGIAIRVVAFSMRSSDARDELRAIDHRYPVIEIADNHSEIQWIDVISESYFVIEDQKKFIDFFISPDINIVTLTITEKAYSLSVNDNLENPQSAVGLLFLGLKKRKQLLGAPLTVLSCDNLRENGKKLKHVVLEYAKLVLDENTRLWIEQYVSFPNSMVDRIVPALTPEKSRDLQKQFNINNPGILATEFFSQWVIEDDFKTEKPSLQKVGVQFVKDVKPFEEMKLRLLNASHSLIAYSGIIKNYVYVHEAIQDPVIKAEVLGLCAEVIPLLDIPGNIDLKKYIEILLKRFNNTSLPHQLQQIAMDGSQKIPQRILPSLKAAYQKNTRCHYLSAALDYWLQYCYECIPDDPLKDEIVLLKENAANFIAFKEKFLPFFI